jgi:hypothetical protein
VVEALLDRGMNVRVPDNFATGSARGCPTSPATRGQSRGDIQTYERVNKAVAVARCFSISPRSKHEELPTSPISLN